MANYDAKNKLGLGLYHFDPRWDSFENFNEIVDRGYFNSFILASEIGTCSGAAQKIREIGGQIWLGTSPYFSAKETLSEYMKKIDKRITALKERDAFDRVVGFHWDEPLLHKPHTNEDFLTMTRALHEEYGLRIFPVFSGYETTGRKGNWNDPEGMLVLEDFATPYITDYGFDSYGYDFRKSTQAQLGRFKTLQEQYPEIHSTESYYHYYLYTLKNRIQNKKARMWVFPCAYTVYTWGGFVCDEDYCIAHLKGLTDILLADDRPGGIFGYTYKTWRQSEPGMDIHLAADNPQRWTRYEEALRETYDRIKDIEIQE